MLRAVGYPTRPGGGSKGETPPRGKAFHASAILVRSALRQSDNGAAAWAVSRPSPADPSEVLPSDRALAEKYQEAKAGDGPPHGAELKAFALVLLRTG
jgi:hypothetical protein